jgi:hypothetical protein
MSMRIRALAAAAVFFAFAAAPAHADLVIHIEKSTQQMTVTVDGQPRYVWPVSTGVAKYDTPNGEFKPFRMEKDHFSKEWDDAPMPYSIFFTKQGHAIHGTNHTSIGRPASHGCVRLSVAHAARLWDLVKAEGMSNTKVVLTGEIPGADLIARNRKNERQYGDEDVTGALPARAQARVYGRRWSSDDDYYGPPPGYIERRQPYYYEPRVYRVEPPPPPPFPFLFGR